MVGDRARFVEGGGFELLGRNSRLIKIEGKRISGEELVGLLVGCELVDEAAVLPHQSNNREVLLAGVVLSVEGERHYRERGKFLTDQRIKQHLLRFVDAVLVPRVIRYLDEMPRTEMGKVTQQALVEVLVSPEVVTLPLVGGVDECRDKLMLSLRVPMGLSYFRGHFEERPIVPGVVLLHWVYCLTEKHWGLVLDQATVNRLKFSKPSTPGDRLTLVLERVVGGVEFLYHNQWQVGMASGHIPLRGGDDA